MSAAASSKKKNPSWAAGDNILLNSLFSSGKLNPTNTGTNYLKKTQEDHFKHILYRNFRTNYIKKAPKFITEQALSGANVLGEYEC